MDNYGIPNHEDEDGGPKKGGHSLRKRARVDYTFEHIDDEVIVPSSTSSARGRKRRSEVNYDSEDLYSTDGKRRGASMGADTPSSRRRNPSRKSADLRAYHEDLDEDDNDVQDTIEVGVSYSDLDESEFRSNDSSPNSDKTHPKHEVAAVSNPAGLDANLQPFQNSNNTAQQPSIYSTVAPTFSAEEPSRNLIAPSSPTAYKSQPPNKPPDRSRASSPANTTSPVITHPPAVDSAPEVTVPPAISSPVATSPVTTSLKNEAAPSLAANAPTVAEQTAQPAVEVQNSIVQTNGEHKSKSEDEIPEDQPATIIKKEIEDEPVHQAQVEEARPPSPLTGEDKMDIDTTEVVSENPGVPFSQPETQTEPQQPLQPVESFQTTPQPERSPSPTVASASPPLPPPSAETVDTPKSPLTVESKTEELKTTDVAVPAAPASPPPSEAQPQPDPEDSKIDSNPEDEVLPSKEPEALSSEKELNGVESAVPSTEPPSAKLNVPDEEPQAPATTAKAATSPEPVDEAPVTSTPPTPSKKQSSLQKPVEVKPHPVKPQPRPSGRWSHLTPYIDDEYVLYPEKKSRSDEYGGADDQPSEEKETDRDGNEMEPMVDDNDDSAEAGHPEAPTPALNTPTRGSPVPESTDLTAFNSPAPAVEDADDADVSESQEASESKRHFKYRKLRDPEEYVSALENYEDMSTEDLFEMLDDINVSLVQWQTEWTELSKIVDDYENSLRRRAADVKYESRTRNLQQHGVNYEEPEFAVKGYKSREKEGMNETRYLQSQDRIMAATYGFEYDPHPSKIGRQNPETQQVGIMTRGRSLRNQPRQTVKATETEEVTGKRQRKPVQLFDPAAQDVSRSSTPVPPTRGRRRRNANGDNEETQANASTSFNTDITSDGENGAPKTRRRRGRGRAAVPSIVEDLAPSQEQDDASVHEEPIKTSRRGRGKPAPRYEEILPHDDMEEDEDEPQPELKQPKRQCLLTLKIPKGKNFSEPSSAITDNGDSRPSTADSESTSHTAESSYSFRPKRQKRFRDDPNGSEETSQAPPKKRGKRNNAVPAAAPLDEPVPSVANWPEPVQTPQSNRKTQKIKVVRSVQESRNSTPASQSTVPEDADGQQKDYKLMTKSEKMSASMKSKLRHSSTIVYIQLTCLQIDGQTATWLEL